MKTYWTFWLVWHELARNYFAGRNVACWLHHKEQVRRCEYRLMRCRHEA